MPLFYLCLALCGVLMGMLAMFFGYSLKLSARTASLEKKNGSEEARLLTQQRQLNQLKAEIAKLKQKDHHDKCDC